MRPLIFENRSRFTRRPPWPEPTDAELDEEDPRVGSDRYRPPKRAFRRGHRLDRPMTVTGERQQHHDGR